MSYFPMFIELEHRKCLVIGGGKVALRKTKVLLDYGASVIAIAPEWEEEFKRLEQTHFNLRRITESFQLSKLSELTMYGADTEEQKVTTGFAFVVVATDQKRINREIAAYCKKYGIPINIADNPELCTFFFPAVVHEEPVSIGITTGGKSPGAAALLKEEIRKLVDDEFLKLVKELSEQRETLKKKEKNSEKRGILMKEFIKKWKRETSMRTYTNSETLFAQSKQVIPGGVNSPVRAFQAVGGTPVFIDHAKGSHIYDVDGNEYLDYVCSWGPGILGHAKEEVIDAVQKVAKDGLTFGAPTKKEWILAELIEEAMPSMELIRMVNSGTEAVMSAIRVARGYTKRDLILKFKGCYHGHSDGLLVKAGSAALTTAVPDSAGVPASYTQNTLVALYNDRGSVQQLFEQYGEQIACVIVEPVAANMGVVLPEEGFLSFLRKITKQYGSLLIFDEVITGFRLSYGGAQELYKVVPDLTTLGKIVGGGMPMAVYGGKKEIMEQVSPCGAVYQAGTLSGNPIATAAGIATLELLKQDLLIYDRLSKKAEKLAKALRQAGERNHREITVNQIGSLLCCYFTKEPVCNYDGAASSDLDQYRQYFHYMLNEGIYIAPSQFEAMFVSDAHTEKEIEETCSVIEKMPFGKLEG